MVLPLLGRPQVGERIADHKGASKNLGTSVIGKIGLS
jgi:hypothetical protein